MKADIEKKKHEAMEARKVEEESLKETLIPLKEHAAREKVAELKSAMNSKKSQGDVVKAVLLSSLSSV
ncbi:hypothetical protein ISN45_Aa05g007620 [Arabidopsis thaliana x Arabidopsis arenosa]|uniref:Uncharacterized protein n=1 Tax=Arabidopsis thaliana x Arabidopsis arenosa TaxID=1240361 RepID=A0A8T1ZL13_9BRAS|nr:hypothetical protein ISN45_Aa05g007620 [Arabidopsis thaliana x Arabidopsis arenosa]